MKKGLSLLLAASMAFSAFAAPVFAADPQTAQEKYDALVEAGIFEGFPDGEAHLDENMTRAQAAKIVALILGLEENADAADIYTDLKDAEWAAGFIGAATEAGVLNGRGNGVFDPSANVTIQELAKIMVEALDLDVDASATVEGADEWAQAYVAAAVAAGLITEQDDYTAPASREILVEASYVAHTYEEPEEVVDAAVAAVGYKTFEVKFGKAVEDTSKISYAIKKGTVTVNVAKVTPAEDKKSAKLEISGQLTEGEYTVTVNGLNTEAVSQTVKVENEKVTKIEFTSDKAPLVRDTAGATSVVDTTKVTLGYKIYNQYNEEVQNRKSGEVTFTASRGGAVGANGTVTITAASGNFLLDEKVSVSAVHNTTGTYATAMVSVAPKASIASLTIDKVVNTTNKDKGLEVGEAAGNFKLVITAKDQYGNTIKNAKIAKEDLIVSVSNPTVATVAGLTAAGQAGFDVQSIDGTNQLVLPLDGTLSGGNSQVMIISNTTGNKANFELVVKAAAKADQLTLSSPSDTAVAGKKIEIPFTAIDQFGNAITKESGLKVGAGLSITSLSVSGAGLTNANIGFEQDYVKDAAKLFVDATGVTNLKTATTVFITAITSTGKVAQTSFTLQPNAKGVVVTAADKVTKGIADGATTTLKASEVTILDQYGSTFKLQDNFTRTFDHDSNAATPNITSDSFRLAVKTSNNGVVQLDANPAATGEVIEFVTAGNTEISLLGLAKGTATITLTLQSYNDKNGDNTPETWEDVANSEYTFNVRVVEVAEITDYEVADVAKLYAKPAANARDYTKGLTVTGLLADGTKVALPKDDSTYYTVTESTYGLSYTGGNFSADDSVDVGGANKEKAFPVVVTVVTKDGTKSVVKDVTVSNVAPEVTTTEVRSSGIVTKESDAVVSVAAADVNTFATKAALANAAIKLVDQYGVEHAQADKFANVLYSGFASAKSIGTFDNAGARTADGNLVAGDSFTVTAITANGKVVVLTVKVKA